MLNFWYKKWKKQHWNQWMLSFCGIYWELNVRSLPRPNHHCMHRVSLSPKTYNMILYCHLSPSSPSTIEVAITQDFEQLLGASIRLLFLNSFSSWTCNCATTFKSPMHLEWAPPYVPSSILFKALLKARMHLFKPIKS